MGYRESQESREEEKFRVWCNGRKERLEELRKDTGFWLQEKYFEPIDFKSRKTILIPKKYHPFTSEVIATPIVDVPHFIFDENPQENSLYVNVEEGIQKCELRGIVVKIHAFSKDFLLKNKIKPPVTDARLVVEHITNNYKKTIESIFQFPIKYAWIDESFTCAFKTGEINSLNLPIIGHRNEEDLCCYFVLINENLLSRYNPRLYKELTEYEMHIDSKCTPHGSLQHKDARGLYFSRLREGTADELEITFLSRELPFVYTILEQLDDVNYNRSHIYRWIFFVRPFVRAIGFGDIRLGQELWGKDVPIINYYIENLKIIS